jgi:TetR/AcrR family transcriptional repressor of lmrAB and yxaGH operons
MKKERTKGAETRAKMVSTMAKLLQLRGYHGTGLSEIIKKSGTPKGSLYYHFPKGKEQLAAAALLESGDDFAAKLRVSLSHETNPARAIELACTTLAQELVDSNFEAGCPLATVALEAASHSEPIRLACVEHFQGWQELIAKMLQGSGVEEERAVELAVTALSTIEGALMLSRVRRSTEPLEQVGRQLNLLLAIVLGTRVEH